MAYTQEDLDNALANSVGPATWDAAGPGNPGWSRLLMIERAAAARWLNRHIENCDAKIIREAYSDLTKFHHFCFSDEAQSEYE